MRMFALSALSGCVWLDAQTHADRRVAATPLDLRVESLDGGPWPACDAALPFEATLSVDRAHAGRELEIEVVRGASALYTATVTPTEDGGRATFSLSGDLVGEAPLDAPGVTLSVTARSGSRAESLAVEVPVDPDVPRWLDADGDGFGAEVRAPACDGAAAEVQGDCDDLDPQRAPDRPERCDGVDTDCDGQVPDDERDADADGWAVCAPFVGVALQGGGDCDDAPGGHDRNPGEPERCNQIDDDCDGQIPLDELDADGDLWVACEGWSGDEGLGLASGDCLEGDVTVHPSADERCDGLDNDCDDFFDPREVDADGDGVLACTAWEVPGPHPPLNDCVPTNPAVYPGAPEICDGLDSNCDGLVPVDEEDPDGDQWVACGSWMAPPDSDVLGGGDCGPSDEDVHPGAPERCNGIDDDCADGVPADELDSDGDDFVACEGWIGVASLASGDCAPDDADRHPGAVELCDRVDQDCDTFVDEGSPGGFYVGGNTYPTLAAAQGDPGVGTLPVFACQDVSSFTLQSGRLHVELQGHTATGPLLISGGAQLTLRSGTVRAPHPSRGFVANGAQVILEGMEVEGTPTGNAPVQGGCARVENAGGLTATATRFAGCRAHLGGAIFATGGTVSLTDVAFEDNTATGEGGAVFLAGSALDAQDARWLGNSASVRGGGLRASGASDVQILGESWFEANEAAEEGGAVYLDGPAALTLDGARLEANGALSGGALACGPEGTVTATDAQFLGNGLLVPAAEFGGAAALDDGCVADFLRGSFQRNAATVGGGALVLGVSDPTTATPTATFDDVDFGEESGIFDTRNTPDAIRVLGIVGQSYAPTGPVDASCDVDGCTFVAP